MRKFNLEEAKAGKPVCTRDGRNARIVCFDVKHPNSPILALVDRDGREYSICYNNEGRFELTRESLNDLFMKPEKREAFGWVGRSHISIFANLYKTKEEALSHKPDIGESFLAKVEWEE